MEINSKTFSTRRYRTLYYLLPVTNGALIALAHAALYQLTRLPQLEAAVTSGDYGLLVDAVFFMAKTMVPVLVIVLLNIAFLTLVYGKDIFLFAFRRLAPGYADESGALPILGPIFLSVSGGVAIVLILRALSLWTAGAGEGSTGSTVLAAIFYILTVVPVLVHGERTGAGEGRGNINEAGA
jgi:hypothetical protein